MDFYGMRIIAQLLRIASREKWNFKKLIAYTFRKLKASFEDSLLLYCTDFMERPQCTMHNASVFENHGVSNNDITSILQFFFFFCIWTLILTNIFWMSLF